MTARDLILASASPRRSALLEQLGLIHRALPADIDESAHKGESAREYTRRLAAAKAERARELAGPDGLIIAADTAIALDDEILTKPEGEDAAVAMLSKLAGRQHEVITSFALDCGESRHLESCVSRVWMNAGDRDLWRAYSASGEPLDKAGAYAIQGLGACLVERIEGSYSNIVGLPLFELGRALKSFGVNVLGQK